MCFGSDRTRLGTEFCLIATFTFFILRRLMFDQMRLNTFLDLKSAKFGNFLADLVVFRVCKYMFSGWAQSPN